MKPTLLALAFLLLVPEVTHAGGPGYSRFGFGDLRFYGSSRAYTMGITGIGLGGDGFINSFNPAGLARISLTRISAGFEFSRVTISDENGSSKLGRGDFQSLAFAVPASQENGFVLFGEASPYSRVRYNVQSRDETPGLVSTQTVHGSGGLSTLSFGSSYDLSSSLSAGIKFTYVYGTILQVVRSDFDDITFADSQFEKSLFHSGSYFTFGLSYNGFSDLFESPSLKALSAGLILTTPARLTVKEERFLLTPFSADTVSVVRGRSDIPLGVGLGVTYRIGERFLLATDVFAQDWSEANFFGSSSVETRNSLRLGFGVEILPHPNPDTYWDRVAYRAGFTYNVSYHKVQGRGIDEWYASGGFALPIGPDARLELGLQIGSRGSAGGGLQKDNFLRLSVSFTASEPWFITIEED